MRKYKIAVFGIAHSHAKLLYKSFMELKDRFIFTGYTDIGFCNHYEERVKRSFPYDNVPYYSDPTELMDTEPDIALVCCENKDHATVAVSLLERGIITILEKPLAISIDDGLKIYRASEENKTPFITNWPVAWFPAFQEAFCRIRSGAIGRPMRFIYRTTATLGPYSHNSENKPKWDDFEKNEWWFRKSSGGGALLDYCCYGSIMACWFLDDDPLSVYGHNRRFMLPNGVGDVDDYAQLTINFKDSVGYAEGSWSTVSTGGIPTGPVIFGTEGTLVADRYSNYVKIYNKRFGREPDEYYENPEKDDTLAKNLLAYLEEGKDLHPLIDFDLNLKAAAVLDAGIRSCESDRLEKVFNYKSLKENEI